MPADGSAVTTLGILGAPAALPEPWVEFLGEVPNATEDEVVPGNEIIMRVHNDAWSSVISTDPFYRSFGILREYPYVGADGGFTKGVVAQADSGPASIFLRNSVGDGYFQDLVWRLNNKAVPPGDIEGTYDIDARENIKWLFSAPLRDNWLYPIGTGLDAEDPVVFYIDAVGVAPTIPGIEWSVAGRLHFDSEGGERLHFEGEHRLHFDGDGDGN